MEAAVSDAPLGNHPLLHKNHSNHCLHPGSQGKSPPAPPPLLQPAPPLPHHHYSEALHHLPRAERSSAPPFSLSQARVPPSSPPVAEAHLVLAHCHVSVTSAPCHPMNNAPTDCLKLKGQDCTQSCATVRDEDYRGAKEHTGTEQAAAATAAQVGVETVSNVPHTACSC